VRGEPEGFREFVLARSPALLRTAWMLTGDSQLAEDQVAGIPRDRARCRRFRAMARQIELHPAPKEVRTLGLAHMPSMSEGSPADHKLIAGARSGSRRAFQDCARRS